MKYFEADFGTVMIRFYLMMAIVVIPFFIGMPWLAFLAFPLLILNMLGLKTRSPKKRKVSVNLKNKKPAVQIA